MAVNMTAQSIAVGDNWTKVGNDYVGSAPNGAGLLFTPTYLIDAEGATIGQNYIGSASDQFTGDATLSIAQNTNVLYGDKAFQMTAPDLSGGFGAWGGRKNFATPLVKGDSAHIQASVYFPSSSFSFDEVFPHLKFLRLRTETSGGSNVGYQDIYLDREAESREIKHIFEGGGSWTYSGEFIQYDAWETIEFRVDFDNIPVDSGGEGRVRIWRKKNGVMTLIIDVTGTGTLQSATDECPFMYIFSYWNGEPTRPSVDQVCYVDRLVIETDMTKLIETDASGNKIIGGIA